MGHGAHPNKNHFVFASWFLLVRVMILAYKNKSAFVFVNFELIWVGLRVVILAYKNKSAFVFVNFELKRVGLRVVILAYKNKSAFVFVNFELIRVGLMGRIRVCTHSSTSTRLSKYMMDIFLVHAYECASTNMLNIPVPQRSNPCFV